MIIILHLLNFKITFDIENLLDWKLLLINNLINENESDSIYLI